MAADNLVQQASINNISAVLIAHNEEKVLATCLQALQPFANIVVYLNNSTDQSRAIATAFNNVVVVDGKFDGFANTRNAAHDFAKNDWIYSVDADEFNSPTLNDSIAVFDLSNPRLLGQVRRLHKFMGKNMTGGMHRPCWCIRLYNKKEYQFSGAVHEGLQNIDSVPTKIMGDLFHQEISFEHQIAKLKQYAKLSQGAKMHKVRPRVIAMLGSLLTFTYLYFFKLGCRDLVPGIVSCYLEAMRHYYKYSKNN